jgi:serine/threonine-protein kinase
MDFKRHVNIGLVAMAKGFLQPDVFADAMIELGMLAEQGVTDSMWLDPGRLSQAQLETVLTIVARLPPGAVLQGMMGPGAFASPPPPSAAPPAPRRTRSTLRQASFATGKGPSLPASSTLGGSGPRYVKVGLLGSGGMGDVEERLDTVLGRRVALKSVRPDVADRQVALALLEQEAKVTGSLEHPNIVPVYDMGLDPKLGTYYVMRVAQQDSLEDVIEQLHRRDAAALGAYSLARLLRVFVQVCNAIEYAHSHGYAHRDLKPANVLLGAYGEVLVVDWGLAHRIGERPTLIGGTPGFIPLEQLDEARPVDARSDVFALGVILFHILHQQAPFAHETAADLAAAFQAPAVGYAIQPPRGAKAPWEVTEDLAEIAVKAIQIEPDARYQSARALAEAVDDFLAGTREKERRQQKADELAESGDMLRESYEELVRERPARVESFLALRNQVPPWEPEEKKQPLWDAEEQFAVMETLAVRTMQAVVTAYEQALDEVPTHEGARRGLTHLYAAELRRAEDRRDNFDRVYFEERIRQLNGDVGRPDAIIDIDSGLVRAEVQLLEHVEQQRRLFAREARTLGVTPLTRVSVPPGSYVLRLQRQGYPAIDYPVLLRPEAELKLSIDLTGSTELSEDEALIPGGPALLGGDDDAKLLREVVVPTFIILREPVTFAQYLQFVADVYHTHPSLAENYLPLSEENSPYFTWTGTKFRPGRILRWGNDAATLIQLPVVGIDAWSAEAYATWRSRRTGRVYRLPTEEEWEKAARGVDGRRYPWGDSFDPSFCKMSASRPTAPAPEPSGTFPIDLSVYGVKGTAGGVADWVITAKDDARDEDGIRRMVSRGGAFTDPQLDCRLASRRHYLAMERASRLGFRLVRTPSVRASSGRIPIAPASLRPDPRAE